MMKNKCKSILWKLLLYTFLFLISIYNFVSNKQYLELEGNELLWFSSIVIIFMFTLPLSLNYFSKYFNCISLKKL